MEYRTRNIIEALLFVSSKPLKLKEAVIAIGDETVNENDVFSAIEELNNEYSISGKPYFIKNIAGGYRYYLKDEYFNYVEELVAEKRRNKLSQKALETVAIVAYKQPITKSEIEAIRGVNVDGVMKTLLERNLIQVNGREHAPGNPLLYGTSPIFLEYFGLNSLEDLPKLKEIDELLEGDSQIKREIGNVILKEIMPEELGLEIGDEVGNIENGNGDDWVNGETEIESDENKTD